MSPEEKMARANDLANKFIPKLSDPHMDFMYELHELTIEDALILFKNANWAVDNQIFPGDSWIATTRDNIQKLEKYIIERMLNSRMYIMYDKSTKLPFIDENNKIWLFTDAHYAEETVAYYRDQPRVFGVDFATKELLAHLQYEMGVGFALINNGQEPVTFDLKKFVDPSVLQQMTMRDDFLENHRFFRALVHFEQERRCAAEYEGKPARVYHYEKDMAIAFKDASFLVPVCKGAIRNGKLKGWLKETKWSEILPKIEGERGKVATPIYTDWTEFSKEYDQAEWDVLILQSTELCILPTRLVMINSGSITEVFSQTMIADFLDRAKNLMRNDDQ